jgi:hypothetical protein
MEQLPKIVQQRLHATAKAGVHPDPDLLAAFAEKSLNERERSQVLQHLGHCSDCRSVLSLAMPEIALSSSPSPGRSTWLAWPVLRWGALTACVVVVSAAITLHYERRESAEPVISLNTPSSTPSPANMQADSRVSNQQGEKVAANIASPPMLQSDRDFVSAGKLAKQREGAEVRMKDSPASELNRLTTLEELKKNSIAYDRLASVGAVESGAVRSGAARSTDKPSQPTGQRAAAVFAPAAPPAAKTGNKEPQTSARNDRKNADLAAGSVTETVTVQSEGAPMPSMAQSVERRARKAKEKDESHRIESDASAGTSTAASAADQKGDPAFSETVLGGYGVPSRARTLPDKTLPDKTVSAETVPAETKTPPRWTVSSDGLLQRSLDSGGTWQTVPVANNVIFRALAANDSDIWVGGSSGALYHSADDGHHWTRITPLADGKPLTADIVKLEFTGAWRGSLTTDTHETWVTNDGGATWHRK